MPYHWWLIDPENPGPKKRAKAVREAAQSYGEVLFVGHTKNGTWFTLVYVDDEREDELYEAVKGRGKLWKLAAPDESSR